VKIRLSFLAHNWLIGQVQAGFDLEDDFKVTEIECSKMQNLTGQANPFKSSDFKNDDDDYFVTYPGEQYKLTFNFPVSNSLEKQSLFIKSKGFYIEWIRNNWIRINQNPNNTSFEMNDSTLIRTTKAWASKKANFEKMFYELKVPLLQGNNND